MLILLIIFASVLYISQIYLFGIQFIVPNPVLIHIIILSLVLIMPLINIIFALIAGRNISNYPEQLLKWSRNVFIIKMVLIPFFIINFCIWFFVTVVGIVPVFMYLLAAGPIGLVYTYWIFLPVSVYAVIVMRGYYKSGKINKSLLILFVISQFIYVIDIIGIIIFWISVKYTNEVTQILDDFMPKKNNPD